MSCDKLTGVCLKCHYNTVGLNCERCKPGFYGDAKKQKCSREYSIIYQTLIANNFSLPVFDLQACKCDPNGTRECDSSTGKCICLPDTTGALCDQCRSSTWRSPNGCVDCQCNTEGTLENSDACDQSNGQCPCREGRVGPKCDQVISETVPQAENTTQTVSSKHKLNSFVPSPVVAEISNSRFKTESLVSLLGSLILQIICVLYDSFF